MKKKSKDILRKKDKKKGLPSSASMIWEILAQNEKLLVDDSQATNKNYQKKRK